MKTETSENTTKIHFSCHLEKTRLVSEFKTALRTVTHGEEFVLKVSHPHFAGIEGIGKAASTLAVTGESAPAMKFIFEEHLAELIQKQFLVELLQDLQQARNFLKKLMLKINSVCFGNGGLKHAIEDSFCDFFCKAFRCSFFDFYELKCEKKELHNDMTISLNSVEEMVQNSENFAKSGFNFLKLKFGGSVSEACNALEAIWIRLNSLKSISSFAFQTVPTLRVDANQAWNFQSTLEFVDFAIAKNITIEFLEQPLHRSQRTEMVKLNEHLKNRNTLLCADESLFVWQDVQSALSSHMCEIVSVKLQKCGGTFAALEAISEAKKHSKAVLISCMLEGAHSCAAAAALAFAFPSIKYVDLDGPLWFQQNLLKENFENQNSSEINSRVANFAGLQVIFTEAGSIQISEANFIKESR